MNQSEIYRIFQDTGALLKGHFKLSSGLHSGQYLQCALVLQYPKYAQKLCRDLALKFKGRKIDAVIGPAYGGIIVAYEVARALGARALFSEREDSTMQLRRNFSIEEGENILLCEDVITTGKSVKEVIEAIKPYRPRIIGVAALLDRTNKHAPFGKIRLESLAKIYIETYKPNRCPLCKDNIPLVKPGSRV